MSFVVDDDDADYYYYYYYYIIIIIIMSDIIPSVASSLCRLWTATEKYSELAVFVYGPLPCLCPAPGDLLPVWRPRQICLRGHH